MKKFMHSTDEMASLITIQGFSALLEKMSPDMLQEFVSILSKGSQYSKNALRTFVKETDELYPIYQAFWKEHSISFAYGNNSKNFVLTSKQDSKDYILKIENRLNAPQDLANHVRENVLPDIITPIYAERAADNASGYEKKSVSINVQLTTLCELGSIEDCAMDEQMPSERINSALHYYSQMAKILKRMGENNCFFADMKNSNWLVDAQGNVKISDTKSFLYIRPDGEYDLSIKENEGYSLLKTEQFSPAEFFLQKTFNAEKAHVAILGKNLYQYLTGCDPNMLADPTYKYDNSIFKTPEGQMFKALIAESTKYNALRALERPSLDTVLAKLEQIQALKVARDETIEVLKTMTTYTLGEEDNVLESYLKIQFEGINNSGDLETLERIKQEAQSISASLRDNTVAKNIANFIEHALPNSSHLSINLTQQLTKLKNDLLNVSLDDRLSSSPKMQQLNNKISDLQISIKQFSDCQSLLKTIESFRISEKDKQMDIFIREKRQALQDASNPTEFQKLETELKQTLEDMQESATLVNNILKTVSEFKADKKIFKLGLKNKAEDIEKALCEVPIRVRKDILIADTLVAKQVRTAIAAKQGLWGYKKPEEATAEELKEWIDPDLIKRAIDILARYTAGIKEIQKQNNEEKNTLVRGPHEFK